MDAVKKNSPIDHHSFASLNDHSQSGSEAVSVDKQMMILWTDLRKLHHRRQRHDFGRDTIQIEPVYQRATPRGQNSWCTAPQWGMGRKIPTFARACQLERIIPASVYQCRNSLLDYL